LRIYVVGDSVGLSLGRGLARWGAETGRAIVLNDATPTCSLGRGLPRKLPLGQVQPPAPACAGWAQRWPQAIRSFDPDAVVVLYSIWEVEPRELLDGRFARPGDPTLDRWQLSEYEAAADVLSARGAQVMWLDVACEGSPIEPDSPFWVVNHWTIPALASTRRAVHPVDMNRLLCGGGPPSAAFGGVADVRPDGVHYSDAGALAVARWLMPIVLGERPAPPRIFN
jgi:hypothetical protein